ncbi:hypothetical protein Cadr_000029649 [Camelus dromedarius]|uniref:Uncharacterized protein n=1 Tax=Camelus dromedarius TaxID=9838 RepID=A0A5N4CB03_CAMDR|nr:hypothetical protein Cadr_000029649 [Camelus dromedarius]
MMHFHTQVTVCWGHWATQTEEETTGSEGRSATRAKYKARFPTTADSYICIILFPCKYQMSSSSQRYYPGAVRRRKCPTGRPLGIA